MSQTDSNQLCEFIGCNSAVFKTIDVKVGHLGQIQLHLCKKCTPKFEDKERSSMQFLANREFRTNGSIIRHDSCNYSKKEKLEQQVVGPACSNTKSESIITTAWGAIR